MKRLLSNILLLASGALAVATLPASAQSGLPACDPDNGGITLPEGFCAMVVADGLGAARHLVVAPNGDLYVAIRNQQDAPGGIIALRDNDGDGRADQQERFGKDGGTSIKLHNNYLYFGRDTAIERYRMRPNSLVPDEPPEVIAILPDQQGHRAKGFAFDGNGGMFVNVGAPSNACQPSGRVPEEAGEDPCALLEHHGGVWTFDRRKRPARATRPACDRTLPWPGTPPRADSTLSSTDAINSTLCGRVGSRTNRTPSYPRKNS